MVALQEKATRHRLREAAIRGHRPPTCTAHRNSRHSKAQREAGGDRETMIATGTRQRQGKVPSHVEGTEAGSKNRVRTGKTEWSQTWC